MDIPVRHEATARSTASPKISTANRRVVSFSTLALLLVGCVGGGAARGVPLYQTRGDAPPLNEVVQLYGDVDTVDGRSVSGGGRSFELLPGCHVVTTKTSWGQKEHSTTMSGNMPKLVYVVPMQPNRSYVFEYDLANRTGNGGTLVFSARELDAAGNTLSHLQPTKDQSEIDRCRSSR